jgi:hypothetical protein
MPYTIDITYFVEHRYERYEFPVLLFMGSAQKLEGYLGLQTVTEVRHISSVRLPRRRKAKGAQFIQIFSHETYT